MSNGQCTDIPRMSVVATMFAVYWRHILLQIFPKPKRAWSITPNTPLLTVTKFRYLIVIFITLRSSNPRSRRSAECSRKQVSFEVRFKNSIRLCCWRETPVRQVSQRRGIHAKCERWLCSLGRSELSGVDLHNGWSILLHGPAVSLGVLVEECMIILAQLLTAKSAIPVVMCL